MDRLRVLQVIRPAQGGMQNHLLELANGLHCRGVDQIIACNRGAMATHFRNAGLKVEEITLPGSVDPVRDALSIVQLVKLIIRYRPIILHLHGAKAGLAGRVAGHLTATPTVVYTAHNSVFHEFWPGWKRRTVAVVEGLLARHTDLVITVSEALRSELIRVAGIPPTRLRTIRNGVRRFSFHGGEGDRVRQEFGIAAKQHVVGCVARFAPQKGLQDLLPAVEMVQRTHPVHLLLVGSGPLEGQLRAQARQLGIEATFAGYRNDVPALLASMDVFVLPSHSEGLPLIILEAMMAGLPIVATRVGGIPEAVIDGCTGRLVEPHRPEQLAVAINEFLSDRTAGSTIASAGAQRVRAQFSVDRMIDETMEAYRELSRRKSLYGV